MDLESRGGVCFRGVFDAIVFVVRFVVWAWGRDCIRVGFEVKGFGLEARFCLGKACYLCL